MPNGPDQARFWIDFVLSRCAYPAPRRFQAQLQDIRFEWFCPCGCNTFRVSHPDAMTLPKLATPSRFIQIVFETQFDLADGNFLDVLIFADARGDLAEIEISCNVNSRRLPDPIVILDERPDARQVSDRILYD